MRITHYSRLLGMNIMMFIFGITLGQPHALGTDETPKSRMVHVVIHVERWDAGPVESYAIRMGDGENWQCCATNEVGDAHFTFDLPYGTSRLYACYPTEDDLKSLPREIPSRHPKVSYNLNSNYYFPSCARSHHSPPWKASRTPSRYRTSRTRTHWCSSLKN
jgi:hypothetical protein